MRWLANYRLLGPYDYLDIYEAPNEEVATKVSAVPLDRFLELVADLAKPFDDFASR